MPLTPLELSCAALAVFCAGLVRGATGFGFSMICIVLLSLLLPPAHIAPVIVLWEIAASAGHLPFVYKEADWKALRHLALGVALGTPPGAYCLASVPAAPMTAVINTVVLVLTGMLFFGFKLRQRPGRWGACVGLGIWLGSRWFRRVDEVRFRRVVLALLLLISLAGLLPSLISITG